MKEFLRTVRNGGDPVSVQFEDMSFVYGFKGSENEDTPTYRVPQDSVFHLSVQQLLVGNSAVHLQELIRSSDVKTDQITLVITESILIQSIDQAA